MLGIQVAIGALNDVMDAPSDAIVKARKPIPAGLVRRREAIALAAGGAFVALGLAASMGPATFVVGATGLGLGWLYDVRLSRTSWSWLPLAVALPLLPVFAWLGATGTVPPGLVTLIPIGLFAGAALALANGIVDVDRDRSSGRSAIVVTLGRQRAWVVQTALLVLAASLALLLAPGGGAGLGDHGGGAGPGDVGGSGATDVLRQARVWGLVLGSLAVAFGAIVLASARAAWRERGWELEAVGVVGLGIGWLAGAAIAGGR
jgi:4-hydroxybenzoate polyprenyltransferase